MTTDCPGVVALSEWLRRGRPEDPALTDHLMSCSRCQGVVEGLSRDFSPTQPGTSAGPELDLSPGTVLLGKYEVQRRLGSGGMGTVVCARHLGLNTLVALKVIRPDLVSDRELVSRFSREARAAVRLKTEHVRRVFDLEQLPSGVPMMVMEYLEGEALDSRVARGPLDIAEAVEWISQALEGLAAAHAAGIVHRDLKPGNLFIQRTPSGEVLKILDFGIAKSDHPEIEAGLVQTSHQLVVGSPAYMSPEQLTSGSVVDLRTDLWSLGCTLFALVVSQPPFAGKDLLEVAWKVRTGPLPEIPRSIPGELAGVLRKCLQRNPADRFQSAQEMAAALALVETQEVALPPARRWPWWAAGAGVAAVAAVAYLGLSAPAPLASAPAPAVAVSGPEAAPPAVRPVPVMDALAARAPAATDAGVLVEPARPAGAPGAQRHALAAAPVRRAASLPPPQRADAGDDVFGQRL